MSRRGPLGQGEYPKSMPELRQAANILIIEALNIVLDREAGAGLNGKMLPKLYERFGIFFPSLG
jgi:flagellin-specific chaperone FliS